MKTIELDNPRPISGEINNDGELVVNFQDQDGTYRTDDPGFDHKVVIKNMTVVANDVNLPIGMGYVQPKENLSDGYTFGEITLSKENLEELINNGQPVKDLYEMNPSVMEEPLINYYDENLKEDDFDEFEDIYGSEQDPLEDIANRYGRDSDEYIDAASKKELRDDATFEQEKQDKIQAVINDKTLNDKVLEDLVNNEDVYISDDCIIEKSYVDDEDEIGPLTEEGLDFVAKTYSFDLIQEEDGSWGIKDTAAEDLAVSPNNEEVKNLEIIGIEEQFEDDGMDYEEIYSEPIDDEYNFDESKNIIFEKIYNKLKEGNQIGDDKDKAWGEGYRAAKTDEHSRFNSSNPYQPGSDLHRYWQNGYNAGEEDLRCGWYNESKTDIFSNILNESSDDWYEEIYERERDGDYETPAECCRCGADCHDGGEIINGDVYCPSCAEHERNK